MPLPPGWVGLFGWLKNPDLLELKLQPQLIKILHVNYVKFHNYKEIYSHSMFGFPIYSPNTAMVDPRFKEFENIHTEVIS